MEERERERGDVSSLHGIAQWYEKAYVGDKGTGQLTRQLTRSLVLLARSFAKHCSLIHTVQAERNDLKAYELMSHSLHG